eukprot:1236347-Amphidinium_carterae.3
MRQKGERQKSAEGQHNLASCVLEKQRTFQSPSHYGTSLGIKLQKETRANGNVWHLAKISGIKCAAISHDRGLRFNFM